MNICYVLATSDLEGATRSLLDLLECSESKTFKSYIIIPNKNQKLENELKIRNIEYKYIKSCTEHDTGFIKNFIKKIINTIACYRIKKFLLAKKINLVHNNSIISIVGMKAAKDLHIIYICHIREMAEKGLNISFIDKNKVIYYLNNAIFNIAISKNIEDTYKKVINNKIIQIYDGLKINNYYIKNKRILDKKVYNLFLAGRITKNKGQFEAVKAINYIKKNTSYKVNLKIVGNVSDNIYYNDIVRFINDNNLEENIKLIPFAVDLKEERMDSDISLTCSYAEALGRVTIEGMLAGELVIGSNNYGTKELIKDGVNGLLYKTGDYKDLANKIIYAIENKDIVRKIAVEGQKYAINNFDTEKQSRKVIEEYKKII